MRFVRSGERIKISASVAVNPKMRAGAGLVDMAAKMGQKAIQSGNIRLGQAGPDGHCAGQRRAYSARLAVKLHEKPEAIDR